MFSPHPPLPNSVALGVLVLVVSACQDHGQPSSNAFVPNYDESRVPAYSLPDPLVSDAGAPVATPDGWVARRQEVLTLFENHMFGATPATSPSIDFELRSEGPAFDGRALRRQVQLSIGEGSTARSVDLLIYLPASADAPIPIFLALNYYGNASIHPDPEIHLTRAWMQENPEFGIVEHRATEATRGVRAWRWPVEEIVERGYGLATLHYGQVEPDFQGGASEGLRSLAAGVAETGEWGAIGVWAWGLSRAMDYLQTDPEVDARRVAVAGHSRLGKAALWAGAQDERFAMVISNNSGAGGAALSRRRYGETVARINTVFPHWFNDSFKEYGEREADLPFDQHMLLALIAPRPVYVASAIEDRWADPRGEFLSAFHAGPVFTLLGGDPIPSGVWPGVGTSLQHTVGYHLRSGGHDLTAYDWDRFMDFADLHFGRGGQRP